MKLGIPGGCIGGGGQPLHHGNPGVIQKRLETTYKEDAGKPIRKC